MRSSLASIALVFGLILAMSQVGVSFLPDASNVFNALPSSGLRVGFYRGRCPNKYVDIQGFIEEEVEKQFRYDPTLLPAFLRLQFHDCFVNGCDASITIEGTTTERVAPANAGVRDFDFIDRLKVKVEEICPDTVSCADIIAIATTTVFKLAGGQDYQVQTGRRDGLRSVKEDVKLPSPSMSVSRSFEFFQAKGFTLEEMVTLLGCHTVGIAHCALFQNRLYYGNTEYDPLMDNSLRQKLLYTCPQYQNSTNVAFLDQSVDYTFKDEYDNYYFQQILNQRGVLPIDQAIARDPSTVGTVVKFANSLSTFNAKLADALLKLQAVDVLTGYNGNIRKVCSKFN
ncbi:hypothetical protein RND81_04G148700 [Saponaria officinalis]|uniref:Peroxidase n=1 Tax=Saponaria officinalis TaxID=3572 RepID=A0AAW1LLE3_SAPOF